MSKRKTKSRDLTGNIIGAVLIFLVILGYKQFGLVGEFVHNVARVTVGNEFNFLDVYLMVMGIVLVLFGTLKAMKPKYFWFMTLLLVAAVLYCGISTKELVGFDVLNDYLDHFGAIWKNTYEVTGGFFGALFYSVTSLLVAKGGTYLVIGLLVLISIIVLVEFKNVKAFFVKIFNSITEPREGEEKKTKRNKIMDTIFEEYDEEEAPAPKRKMAFIKADCQRKKETIEEKIVSAREKTEVEEEESEEAPRKPEVIKKSLEVKNTSNKKDEAGEPVSVNPNTTSAATAKGTSTPYSLPKLTKLDTQINKKGSVENRNAAKENGERLLEILDDFDIPCSLEAITIGPSVTKFEIKPDSTVKISRISQIQDNLKMELAAKSIRIEAPVPGKRVVGIEIPNREMTMVKMYEIMTSFPANSENKKLLFGLGKGLSGEPIFCQLDKMPHLLVAGATGSGKSVCINGIITTFLLRTKPDEVKLLLIDPKKVEFTPYKDIPHLIGPVISDAHEASLALQVIVKYMENRYSEFAKYGVRNIEGYNEYVEYHKDEKLDKMYRIVVIIDELADLMSTNKKDVEQSIQRITQLARAAGIHLIVATQRPSTDVITGVIKANIPSRIAFAVSSGVDSRTILDTYGAEKLLGNGDMLYSPIGEQSPIRVQGVFVSDREVEEIAKECAKKQHPHFNDEFVALKDVDHDALGFDSNGQPDDPMYNECKEFVCEQQKASTSLLQRKFGIGYNRAARIIDALEQNGVIGPQQGSKPREVFYILNEDGEIVSKN